MEDRRTTGLRRAVLPALLGIGLGVLYFLIGTAVDALAFGDRSFWELLLHPTSHPSFWSRTLAVCLFILVGVFSILVTRRRRAEGELGLLRAHHERILQSVFEGIVVEDPAGCFEYVNPTAANLLGYLPDELIGQHWTTIVPPDQQPIVRAANVRRSGGVADRYELSLVRKDGIRVPVLVAGSPRLEDGKYVGTIGVFTDITKRIRAEEALRIAQTETRRRLDEQMALREAASAITSTLELDAVLSQIAEQLAKASDATSAYLCSFDRESMTSTVLADYIGPHACPAELESDVGIRYPMKDSRFIQSLLSGQAWCDQIDDPDMPAQDQEHMVQFGAQSILYVPLYAGERTLGYAELRETRHRRDFTAEEVALCQAIAQHAAIAIENAQLHSETRRRLEEQTALREAIAVFSSALDQEAVLQHIAERLARAVDATSAHITEHQPDEMAYTVLAEYLTSDSHAREPVSELTRTFAYDDKDSEFLELMLAGQYDISQVDDPDLPEHKRDYMEQYGAKSILYIPLIIRGRLVGFTELWDSQRRREFTPEEIALCRSMAQQAAIAIENANLYGEVRRQAAELASAVEHLQELDHLKDEFIQNTSHELRSPLALVRGYAELLADGELGDLTPEQQEAVEVIRRRTKMLSDLVEDITVILLAETRPLSEEQIELCELVDAAVTDFRVAADKAGLRLTAAIATDPVAVRGEVVYLRRVVDNLLANAVKFTTSGGQVSVSLSRRGDQAVLQVADSGIGIPPAEQDLIFERFYRADGSKHRELRGTGLGLSLVKEIVEAHGGAVGVHSEVGTGTIFTVTLPVCVD